MKPPNDQQKLVLVDPRSGKLSERERKELSLDELRQIEDELAQEAGQVIHGALAFADISPDTAEAPREWVELYGRKNAEKRLRLAKAAWLPNSEAPVGLKLAQAVCIGMARVRAGDKAVIQNLNIGVVELPAALPVFREIEVEERK